MAPTDRRVRATGVFGSNDDRLPGHPIVPVNTADELLADVDVVARPTVSEAPGAEWTLAVPASTASPPGDGLRKLTTATTHLRSALQSAEAREAAFARDVYAFARRLARTRDVRRIHALILRTLARRAGARIGALAVYREEERALAITATHGYPPVLVEHLRIVPGEGILGGSFVKGRAEIVEAPLRTRRRYRTNSYMLVPLTGPNGALGVIALTDQTENLPFADADLTRVRVFAAVAGLGLTAGAAQQRLADVTHLAAIDSVTGLLNRRHFDARIDAEVQRAHRHRQPLSLLLADIDDFKRINDRFGHPEGDRALRAVADVLRDGVRIFDVCARYGGDEMVILMPRASIDVAARIAERVRERVQCRFAADALGVTISLGAATLEAAGTPQDLVAEADRRLRAAKQHGKNAVEVAG